MRAWKSKVSLALIILTMLLPCYVYGNEIADLTGHEHSVTVSAISSGAEPGRYHTETEKGDADLPDFSVDVSEATIEYEIADEADRENVVLGNHYFVKFICGRAYYDAIKAGLNGAALKTVLDVEKQYSSDAAILPIDINVEKYLAYDDKGENPIEGSRREIRELSTPVRFCFDAPDIDTTRQKYRNYHLIRFVGERAEVVDSLTLGYDQTARGWRFSFDAENSSAYALYYEIGPVTYHLYVDRNDYAGGMVFPAAKEMLPGEKVQIEAIPNAGYEFAGWYLMDGSEDVILLDDEDNPDPKSNPVFFAAPAHDVFVRADFLPVRYTLSTEIGEGFGSLQAFNSSNIPVSTATVGEEITVQAIPETGYQVKNWVLTAKDSDQTIRWAADEENREISFSMPACGVDIRVDFEKIPTEIHALILKVDSAEQGRAFLKDGYSPQMEEGASAIIIAEPQEGYEFEKWVVTGAGALVDNPFSERAVFTMGKEEALVRAVFKLSEAEKYQIYIKDGENGSVSGPSYGKAGENVTLTALPDLGYRFLRWELQGIEIRDGESENPLSFAMPKTSISAEAVFTPVKITTAVSPAGAGMVKKSDIGNAVSLSAISEPGFYFVKWILSEGTDLVLKDTENASVSFRPGHQDTTITAVFDREEYHTITLNCQGSGAVSVSPMYARAGESIVLKALPVEGYELKEYRVVSGDMTLTEPYTDTYSFLMGEEDLIITAVLTPKKYVIRLSTDDHGICYANSDAVTGSSEEGSVGVPYGSTVSLIASPDSGYRFQKWVVSGASVTQTTSVRTTFVMPPNDVTVKSFFEPNKGTAEQFTLTIQSDGHGIANAAKTSAKAGDIVSITANPDSGYSFYKWEPVSGSVYFLDNTKASTKILMPSADATIRAVFQQVISAGTSTNPSTMEDTAHLYSSIFRDWNGVVIKTTVQTLGAPIPEPSPLSDFQMDGKNYSFVCWWSDENRIFDGICHGNHIFTALYYVTGAAPKDNQQQVKNSGGSEGKAEVKTTTITNQNREAVKNCRGISGDHKGVSCPE